MEEQVETKEVVVNKNKRFRKPKPWDDDSVDKWKQAEWKPEFMPAPLLEESSFATLFPKYREDYLKEFWPNIQQELQKYGVVGALNLVEGSMTVKTTRKTWDPFVILKARDLIKLLSRSVPYQQAIKILQDGMECDIIKIGSFSRNKDKFIKRRQRLIGPNGATLKAIELVTKCYMLVQGNTVCSMGDFKGLKQLRRIVIDCMKNVHPIYHIKELMIKAELAKDPKLASESWDRFLPKFHAKKAKKKQNRAIKSKKGDDKELNPFPDPITPSKEDLEIETGEYFIKEKKRLEKKQKDKILQKKKEQKEKKQKSEDQDQ